MGRGPNAYRALTGAPEMWERIMGDAITAGDYPKSEIWKGRDPEFSVHPKDRRKDGDSWRVACLDNRKVYKDSDSGVFILRLNAYSYSLPAFALVRIDPNDTRIYGRGHPKGWQELCFGTVEQVIFAIFKTTGEDVRPAELRAIHDADERDD